jgi:hypothetical protein
LDGFGTELALLMEDILDVEQMRHDISNLLTQMTANYQQTKPDRLTLKSFTTPSTESFSILAF